MLGIHTMMSSADHLLFQAGFESVVANSNIITYITYSIHTSSHKLRAHVADVLAALCVLSLSSGHRVVLAAFSDFRITYGEKFRFEYLVQSIAMKENLPGTSQEEQQEEDQEDEAGLWEYRTAGMALINALANSPDDLEERMALREEFTRRGLNEVMTVCTNGLLLL